MMRFWYRTRDPRVRHAPNAFTTHLEPPLPVSIRIAALSRRCSARIVAGRELCQVRKLAARCWLQKAAAACSNRPFCLL